MSNAEHIKQTLSTNKPYRHQQHHLPKISQNVSGALLLSMVSLLAVYKRGKAMEDSMKEVYCFRASLSWRELPGCQLQTT